MCFHDGMPHYPVSEGSVLSHRTETHLPRNISIFQNQYGMVLENRLPAKALRPSSLLSFSHSTMKEDEAGVPASGPWWVLTKYPSTLCLLRVDGGAKIELQKGKNKCLMADNSSNFQEAYYWHNHANL